MAAHSASNVIPDAVPLVKPMSEAPPAADAEGDNSLEQTLVNAATLEITGELPDGNAASRSSDLPPSSASGTSAERDSCPQRGDAEAPTCLLYTSDAADE